MKTPIKWYHRRSHLTIDCRRNWYLPSINRAASALLVLVFTVPQKKIPSLLTKIIMVWGLSPSKYVVQAVKNCQIHLTEKLNVRYLIPARADNPFPVDYDPSTDLSNILDPECSSFYQHLIGVMRWMVELGCIDIATKISTLSSYLGSPCEGHLENALHVMGYLRLKHNSQVIFDPTYPDIDLTAFPSFE